MTKLQKELKEMGINPSEWDLVLLDEDVLDELVIYEDEDEEE
jgi:hypothetical protein